VVKTIASAIVLACVVAFAAGCATIVHGTTQPVQIDSIPRGADVAIDDSQHVSTPASVKLARASAHRLVFHKTGFQDATEQLTSSPSGWMLGNLLAGGLVGMAIDASDGAGRKLSTDSVSVTLTPLPSPSGAVTLAVSPHALPSAASVHGTQRAVSAPKLRPASTQPELMPVWQGGAPQEDFTDDESGFARPAAAEP
jgi:hypothetical protein